MDHSFCAACRTFKEFCRNTPTLVEPNVFCASESVNMNGFVASVTTDLSATVQLYESVLSKGVRAVEKYGSAATVISLSENDASGGIA